MIRKDECLPYHTLLQILALVPVQKLPVCNVNRFHPRHRHSSAVQTGLIDFKQFLYRPT